MRAFLAVEISEEARGAIARLQDQLRSAGADVKWVEPHNLHLTLKFLGEIKESRVPELTERLNASLQTPPFAFTLEGSGAFPQPEHPKVLWAGVNEGKDSLIRLANEVETACNGCGFPPEERPFSPHLTIGRVRSPQGLSRLVQKLQGTEFRGGKTDAGEILLFQSTLGPGSPVYQPVQKIPLKSR